MAKKKKYTPLQKAYKKELNRIKSGISKNIKKGYVYNKIPQMPKKVTRKALEKIKQKKPLDYAIKTKRVDILTGELLQSNKFKPIKQASTQQNIPQANKMKYNTFTTNVIKEFKESFYYFPAPIRDKILAWLNTMIIEQGNEDVATMILNSPEKLSYYLKHYAYDSETAINEYCTVMIEYLPNASEEYKKNLMDLFENEELGYIIE